MQHEISRPTALLDSTGNLTQLGYARRPVLTYNPENVQVGGKRFRIKEWDYFGITTPDHYLSVCITNLGYMGLVFAYFIEFESKTFLDNFTVTPLGKGVAMPRTSEEGDNLFSKKGVKVSLLRRNEERRILVDWEKFKKKKRLVADITLKQPDAMDSIVMATPMKDGCFYYNQKTNCMSATGHFTLGDEKHEYAPTSALGSLDWGRGVWPYKTFWIWASASGFLQDKRTIGLNLGCGFGDLSAATENCFFIDGKMSKLEEVEIEYDKKDYLKPWIFEGEKGRLSLTFTPMYNRKNRINAGVIKAVGNQVFGKYNGSVVDDQGESYKIKDMVGWAEDHTARW